MRQFVFAFALASTFIAVSAAARANEFDTFGAAPSGFSPPQSDIAFSFVLGGGASYAPAYEGASDYTVRFAPIVDVERFRLGFIDIDKARDAGGLSFAPSFGVVPERKSADYSAIRGLSNVDATYALGLRVGYAFALNDVVDAEIYGAGRYAFGGASGLVGEAGIELTANLTSQLTVSGGPVVAFAGEDYMDTYFGVSSAESVATGGRLGAYDPAGGIKSVGVKANLRYEFYPDTFVNLNGSYASYVGDARNSPVVASGSSDQFTVGLGLARRFAF